MRVRFAAGLVAALSATWAVAAPAAALEPGVIVDPGSPAGKEYGVPLSVLRGEASRHAPVGGAGLPLFGVGISPPPASRAAAPSSRRRRERTGARQAHPSARGRAVAGAGGAGGASAVNPRAGAGTAGGAPVPGAVLAGLTRHGSFVPAVALVAGLVVLGGLGVGALLVAARRRLD
jgi:hypothetical protein